MEQIAHGQQILLELLAGIVLRVLAQLVLAGQRRLIPSNSEELAELQQSLTVVATAGVVMIATSLILRARQLAGEMANLTFEKADARSLPFPLQQKSSSVNLLMKLAHRASAPRRMRAANPAAARTPE